MFLKKYKNKKAAGERGCCCKSPSPVSGGCFGCGASPPKYTKPVSASLLSPQHTGEAERQPGNRTEGQQEGGQQR